MQKRTRIMMAGFIAAAAGGLTIASSDVDSTYQSSAMVGISTSGRSRNVVAAFRQARELGVRRVALTGGTGGDLAELADVNVLVPSPDTQHVQAVHTVLIHAICEVVEERLAADEPEEAAEPHQTPTTDAVDNGQQVHAWRNP